MHERMTAREYQDKLLIEQGHDESLLILDLLGRFSHEIVSERLDIPLSTVLKFKKSYN